MQRVMTAAVSLVFAGCIVIPVHVGGVSGGGSVQAHKEAVVRAALAGAKQKIAVAPNRFRRALCGRLGKVCYATSDVSNALASLGDDLQKSFPREAEPLRLAIAKELAERTKILGNPEPILDYRVKSGERKQGYDAVLVRAAFQRIVAVLDRFLSINDLALTLKVQSTPRNAGFLMEIPANRGTRRKVTTNSTIPNVWRGVYEATVHKRGFKDAVTTVDLINDGRTDVICTLMPHNAPDDSICHVQ